MIPLFKQSILYGVSYSQCSAVLIGCCLQLCGGKASEGVFVGTFLSMSSTAVVKLYAILLHACVLTNVDNLPLTWIYSFLVDKLHSCGFKVLKFLMEKNSTNALHGQVTIGTLILQVCNIYSYSGRQFI